MAEKVRVALLFGGRSAEHEVSVLSAANVFRALDPARYETVPIGIARSGTWVICPVQDGVFPAAVPESGPRAALVPGGSGASSSCRRPMGRRLTCRSRSMSSFRFCMVRSARTELCRA